MKKPTPEGQPLQSGAADQGPVGPSQSATLDPPQSIAGAIGVVRGEVSPEEKARARQMLDALQQIRDRSPRATGGKADPRLQENSDAASGDANSKRIKLDDMLSPALAEAGYKKVAKLTYRAGWSTDDAEQFLSFHTSGVPKQYLWGDAGLRNMKAETFAEQCQQRYASQTYFRCMPKGGYVYPPYFCLMYFEIGSLFGWESGSLDMWSLSPDELARAIVEPIHSKLIPCIGGITTIERLHDFLESDREPLRWYMRGPYYRAALVAYLARQLGVAREKTKASLLTHAMLIDNGIDTTRLTAESYIDHILDDAESAISGGQAS
jgi:hypothetical protein